MSEQEKPSDEAGSSSERSSEPGDQQSRFLPGARIEAEDIKATNVVSGAQHIGEQHIHLPAQHYALPMQLPRRAEHFQDRVSERTWLLAQLHPGRIVTICGPGGMGKTALVAEVLWTLAPGDSPPAAFPHGIVFHSFYGRPEAAVALEQLARTFGEDPLPSPAEAARRALGGKRALLVLDGAEEAQNLERVLAVSGSCAVLVTSRRRSDATDPVLLLDLPRLPQDEAVAVVQAWQAQRQADEVVAARICQLVGGLPLALRLAGSYLALHPDEGEEYLAWLEEDLWGALDQGSSSRKSVPILLERSPLATRSPGRAAPGWAPGTGSLCAGVGRGRAGVLYCSRPAHAGGGGGLRPPGACRFFLRSKPSAHPHLCTPGAAGRRGGNAASCPRRPPAHGAD